MYIVPFTVRNAGPPESPGAVFASTGVVLVKFHLMYVPVTMSMGVVPKFSVPFAGNVPLRPLSPSALFTVTGECQHLADGRSLTIKGVGVTPGTGRSSSITIASNSPSASPLLPPFQAGVDEDVNTVVDDAVQPESAAGLRHGELTIVSGQAMYSSGT